MPRIPQNFIALPDAARRTGSKTNVLRKHRTAGWLSQGLAAKDGRGMWWIDPAVLASIKPVVSRPVSAVEGRVAHSPVPPALIAAEGPDPASPELAVRRYGPPKWFEPVSIAYMQGLIDPAHPAPANRNENESALASAITCLLRFGPVPWATVCKLAAMGRAMEKGAKHAPAR